MMGTDAIGFYGFSLTGTSHKEKGLPCQDAHRVSRLDNGWIVAAIADGLGSRSHSDAGSSLAVQTVMELAGTLCPLIWDEAGLCALLRICFEQALVRIEGLSRQDGVPLAEYDTTLTAAFYDGHNLVYGHCGDGGITTLGPFGDFDRPTPLQKGEAANETATLRGGRQSWAFGQAPDEVLAFAMMTDGVLETAYPALLSTETQPLFVQYIRGFLDRNILAVETAEETLAAGEKVCAYFEGPGQESIGDDITLVGVLNLEELPQVKADEYYAVPDWQALYAARQEKLYPAEDFAAFEEKPPEGEDLICNDGLEELPLNKESSK